VLHAQDGVNEADWQPVSLQRIDGQLRLQLPPDMVAAAAADAWLNLQIGGVYQLLLCLHA
jgi:hypothetical protein